MAGVKKGKNAVKGKSGKGERGKSRDGKRPGQEDKEVAVLPPQERVQHVRPFWEAQSEEQRLSFLTVSVEELKQRAVELTLKSKKEAESAGEKTVLDENSQGERTVLESLEEGLRRMEERGTWKLWSWPKSDMTFTDADSFRAYVEEHHLDEELKKLLQKEEGRKTEKPAEARLRERMMELLQSVQTNNRHIHEECYSKRSRRLQKATDQATVLRDANIDLIILMVQKLEEENELLYQAVLHPVATFVYELLPENMRESTPTELFFDDLEKLPPAETTHICEWLTEKIDSFSSRIKPEAKDAAEEEEGIGDVDLFTVFDDGKSLRVNDKWLNHLQERLLGEDGHPHKAGPGEDPKRMGLVLEWIYGSIVSTAEKGRDAAKRPLGSRQPSVIQAHRHLQAGLRDQLEWETRARMAKELLQDILKSRSEAAELSTRYDIRPVPKSADGEAPLENNELPEFAIIAMLKREVLLTKAKLHALHYEHILGERKLQSLKSQLRQGEPEFDRLKRELEEVKNAPRGIEGTFRTAAEMERHRAQLADAAIEEQLEVQTAFREHGARLQGIYDKRQRTELEMARREQEMKQLQGWRQTVQTLIDRFEELTKAAEGEESPTGGEDVEEGGETTLVAIQQAATAAASPGDRQLQLQKLRQHFQKDVRRQLYTSEDDKAFYEWIQKELRAVEQKLEEGRAAIQHLEAHFINVACDDPGAAIGAQLVLPLLQERLEEKALEFAAERAAQAEQDLINVELERQEREKAEREKKLKVKQKAKEKLRSEKEKAAAERIARETEERLAKENEERQRQLAEEDERKRRLEELERIRKAEEQEMEERRQQLMSEEGGYWRERMAQEQAAQALIIDRMVLQVRDAEYTDGALDTVLGDAPQQDQKAAQGGKAASRRRSADGRPDGPPASGKGPSRGPHMNGRAYGPEGRQRPGPGSAHRPEGPNGLGAERKESGKRPHPRAPEVPRGGTAGARPAQTAGPTDGSGAGAGGGSEEGFRSRQQPPPHSGMAGQPPSANGVPRVVTVPESTGAEPSAASTPTAATGPNRAQSQPALFPTAGSFLALKHGQGVGPAPPPPSAAPPPRPPAEVRPLLAPVSLPEPVVSPPPQPQTQSPKAPTRPPLGDLPRPSMPAPVPPAPASPAVPPKGPSVHQASSSPPRLGLEGQMPKPLLRGPQPGPHMFAGPPPHPLYPLPGPYPQGPMGMLPSWQMEAGAAGPPMGRHPGPPAGRPAGMSRDGGADFSGRPVRPSDPAAPPLMPSGAAGFPFPPQQGPVPMHGLPPNQLMPNGMPMLVYPPPPIATPPPNFPLPPGQMPMPGVGSHEVAVRPMPSTSGMPMLLGQAPGHPLPGPPQPPPAGPHRPRGMPPGAGLGTAGEAAHPHPSPQHQGAPVRVPSPGPPPPGPAGGLSLPSLSGVKTQLRAGAQPFVPSSMRQAQMQGQANGFQAPYSYTPAAPPAPRQPPYPAVPSSGPRLSKFPPMLQTPAGWSQEPASQPAEGPGLAGFSGPPSETLLEPVARPSTPAKIPVQRPHVKPFQNGYPERQAGTEDRSTPAPTTATPPESTSSSPMAARAAATPAVEAPAPSAATNMSAAVPEREAAPADRDGPSATPSSTGEPAPSAAGDKRRLVVRAGGVVLEGLRGDAMKRLRLVRGLSNNVGQYNCFLNVIIQSLWHLRAFREALLAVPADRLAASGGPAGDVRVRIALHNIFYAFAQGPPDVDDAALPGNGSEASSRGAEGLEGPREDAAANRKAGAGQASSSGRSWAISPTELREALSGLKQGRTPVQFELTEMHDASEVLGEIFNCLHHAELGAAAAGFDPTLPQRIKLPPGAAAALGGGPAGPGQDVLGASVATQPQSTVQKLFGIQVQVVSSTPRDEEQKPRSRRSSSGVGMKGQWQQAQTRQSSSSAAAGAASRAAVDSAAAGKKAAEPNAVEVLQYTKYFHLVPAQALQRASVGVGRGFEAALREVHESEGLWGGGLANGAGPGIPGTRLMARPSIFSLAIVWESAQAPVESISSTVDALQLKLDLKQIFRGVTSTSVYSLRCMICYLRHHYQSYVLSEELNLWLLFDDTNIKLIGDWADVVANIKLQRHQPSVLFYELSES